MSKYTTEVRFICERASGLSESSGYNSVNDIITQAIPHVFNFDFPIFDEAYRNVLLKKILKHYYTREIGEETVGLWKLRMDTRLNEIMPYYNQLYKSELLEFNPLYDVDYTRTHEGKGTNTRTENSEKELSETDNRIIGEELTKGVNESDTRNSTDNREIESINDVTSSNKIDGTSNVNTTNDRTTTNDEISNSLDKYSDTPQGALTNVENGTYLTNARGIDGARNNTEVIDDESTSSTVNEETSSGTGTSTYTENNGNIHTETGSKEIEETGKKDTTDNRTRSVNDTTNLSGEVNSTEEYLEKVSGKIGSANYSEMLMKYRNTFLNIDMEIINNLEDLFFGLW